MSTNKNGKQAAAENAAKKPFDVKRLAGIGLLTAIVVVLQVLAIAIRPLGIFNISLVLAPIVVGAALYGITAGTWLGFVFGVVVTLTDSAAFMVINAPATIAICILKGALAGLAAGAVYKLISRKNATVAVIISAVVCPVVNTGVFLLGCVAFFMETITEWAAALGYANAGAYLIFGMVGVNFIIEMLINLVLSSVIVRLVKLGKKK